MMKFLSFIYSKTIEIPISEEDTYEKNVVMYVVIGEPRHIAGIYINIRICHNWLFFQMLFEITVEKEGCFHLSSLRSILLLLFYDDLTNFLSKNN